MGKGVNTGTRMQPVVADLQEGHGDPNKVRGSNRISFLPSGNPHQTLTTHGCQTQESNDLQHLQLMKY